MNINKTIIKLFLASVVIGTTTAQAKPSKYVNCPDVEIVEPKNSSGYFLSEDCQTAYILPPKIGTLRIGEYSNTINVQKTCASIDAIEDSRTNYDIMNNSLSKRAARYAKKMTEIDEMIEAGLIPVGQTEDELYDELDTIISKNTSIKNRSFENDKLLVQDLEHYAQREGSKGVFFMEDVFSKLVSDYTTLNNDQPVRFARLPIDQSYLAIVDKTSDSELNKIEMPALLDLVVPELSTSIKPLNTIGMSLTDNPSPKVENSKLIFGGALSGKIRFTAMGACALERATKNASEFSMNGVASEVSANVFYQYQVSVKRRHSLTFKMSELIRKIHTQYKKGGFFSRKTINKLVDNRRTTSWIKFHVESDDTRFEYTDDYIKEVKKEFIARAIAQIIASKTGNPIAQLTLIDPAGKSGADTIGSELQKCPHLYCQIGGAAFRVLGSIFNRSKAVSDLSQTFKGDFRETVLEKKMVEQVGSMTFE